MNKTFSEYSTGIAFSLQLSKLQCHALLSLAGGTDGFAKHDGCASLHTVGTMRQLEARGLVAWGYDERGRAVKFKGLTRAGRVLAILLKEAGLNVQNTATLSVLRRMDRREAA